MTTHPRKKSVLANIVEKTQMKNFVIANVLKRTKQITNIEEFLKQQQITR